MLSARRARFYSLVNLAYGMTTEDLAKWITNDTLGCDRAFLLSRLACLRIYTTRTVDSGRTYARRRDAARVRLGLLSPRLQRALGTQRLTNAGKPWELLEDLQLRSLYFSGHTLSVISERMQRTREGIERRLAHLQLLSDEDQRHA